MPFPIISTTTSDNLTLHGLLFEAEGADTLFLLIHGTAGNFYEEGFIEPLSRTLVAQGVSFLSFNNRGAGVYDPWQKTGAAVELFEDSVIDIDAWIQYALSKGYANVVLCGHSLGTEKVVYYMNHGTHKDVVRSAVLLAPSDSKGFQLYGDPSNATSPDGAQIQKYLSQAQTLVAGGKGDQFLPRDAYATLMPKSAASFVNFVGADSPLSQALPFHTKKLEAYSKIDIPILALIGDQEEYTVVPVDEALTLMKTENPNTQAMQLSDCNHDFAGKEDEISRLIAKFIV